MGKDTTISWTDASANESFGCRKVDAACENCYMFRMRKAWGQEGTDIVRFDLHRLAAKIKAWPVDKHFIFLDDMSDLFGEFNDDERIEDTLHIVVEENPDRVFQLLTKRIGRAMVFFRKRKVPDNVWLGCSIGERSRLKRLEQLRPIKAKVRFVSFEPVIEDLGLPDLTGIDWIIIGGESGSNPREMKPEWAENIIVAARKVDAKVWFKQMGGRGGGGAGGDLLNGRQIREMPD